MSVQVYCFLFEEKNTQVSIHHMCRFKISNLVSALMKTEFQYIICVGSSKDLLKGEKESIVSIHHMCRFKFFC